MINRDVLDAMHRRLEGMEGPYAQRLTEAYTRIYGRLAREAEGFVREIAARQAAGEALTQGEIRRMARYNYLLATTKAEGERYASLVENEVALGQLEFALQGSADARALVEAAYSGLPPEMQASITATFRVMPREAVEALVSALREDSPLVMRTLARFGAEHVQGIGDALLYGIATGRGPRETAREMAKAFGVPLTDALRIARTEHVRAHRLATMESYRRNPHIVKGWIWASALIPGRTCMACVAQDGTRHPLEETLDDHPNGLCVMLPETVTMAELGLEGVPETGVEVEGGEAWFARQPEAVQRQMMGPTAYEAWREGKIPSLQAFVHEDHDEDWGRTIREAALSEILGAQE